ncbi:MAG: ATP-binding cassette domain-containing protein [Deltaproteobacteria bacterium]|nr:ATP-binding cassette domain-containing protein [Deltaproteobacteria bacterium]
MIELKNIHKSFGPHQVLKGINLQIPDKKITVIIGRSGEGKSVLLKHIMRLLDPDQGKVVVDGCDLSSLDDHGIMEFRKKFGMLFQGAALFDSLNVFDNIAFPLVEHASMGSAQIRKRVQEVLELVGLKDIDAKMPSDLSGGMRKRVGLARAIALTPQILLYDEPTTGLDPLMTDSITNLIHDTQEKLGVTSVVISHDIGASFKIADKVAMVYEGEILLEGDEKAFRSSKIPFIKRFLEGKSEQEDVLTY